MRPTLIGSMMTSPIFWRHHENLADFGKLRAIYQKQQFKNQPPAHLPRPNKKSAKVGAFTSCTDAYLLSSFLGFVV